MKNFKTKIIVSLMIFFIASLFIFPKAALAEEEGGDSSCDPEYLIYKQADHWWDLDIRRIVGNMITSVFVSMYANINGVTLTDMIGCESYLARSFAYPSDFLPEGVEACGARTDDECRIIVNNVKVGGGTNIANESNISKSVRGSILGLAYSLEDFNRKEPLVLNLAYFWNKSIAKVPFVNKAWAAPVSVERYNMPLLSAAFEIWKLCRNVSLGIISIVLLYTGILIIMRKKVNQQLVVSVQYAIPKIAIGLLLIIFSYPIGAAIVAIAWGIFRGGYSIVMSFVPGMLGWGGGVHSAGEVFAAIQVAQMRFGMGYGVLLMTIVISILCAVLWFVVNIKASFIYLKMVLAVITAPFEMAIGTVPGSEARMTDWFKRMAKHGLSIAAMGFTIPVIVLLGFTTLRAYAEANAETSGWGNIMRIIVPLGVVVYGFITALSIDKTVAGFFGEDKKKK
ncbi:hypothetical protein GYA37_02620 [candidate division WWE3 bacterium]|uniref:Uncharacterized protein n=1 Tax=candidate division WWE3 bacterium TaxID=2053526 RepID=A0A7X9HT02_UNCKA|nr:hypothetical protein [candidate division WWE3 bacterium]